MEDDADWPEILDVPTPQVVPVTQEPEPSPEEKLGKVVIEQGLPFVPVWPSAPKYYGPN